MGRKKRKTQKPKRKMKDMALRRLVNHNDVFCSVINYFLPPEERKQPEDIEEYTEELQYYNEEQLRYVSRDVVKKVKGLGIVWIVGIENQCYEDDWFPIRMLCYDALSYYNAYRMREDRRRSGSTTDKEPPVITTYTLNFSRMKLDGMKLSDLWEEKPCLSSAEYTLHSIDVCYLDKENRERLEKGDLKTLLSYIAGDGPLSVRLEDLNHGEDTLKVFRELTENNASPIIRKGAKKAMMDLTRLYENVEKLHDMWTEEAEKKGIEQGIQLEKKESLSNRNQIIYSLNSLGVPLETIAIATKLSTSEVEQILQEPTPSYGTSEKQEL